MPDQPAKTGLPEVARRLLDGLRTINQHQRHTLSRLVTLVHGWLRNTHPSAALLVAAVGFPAFAEDVIKEDSSGGINWTDGVVFAHGYGTAKASLSSAQRRILARRAAVVDAQRNLLEMTQGVRINSVLRTDQAMQQSREIATRVEGIIKGAAITRDHYQNDVATVTMAMPISGRFLQAVLPGPPDNAIYRVTAPGAIDQLLATADRWLGTFSLLPTAHAADPFVIRNDKDAATVRLVLEWMEKNQGLSAQAELDTALKAFEAGNQFSGLLIDASAVPDFELATIPNIRDEKGKVIYPTEATSYDDIVNKRGVTYDFDLEDAIRNKRVARTPFVIKALSTYKNLASDLVIRIDDANRVGQSSSTVEAMNRAGVLIVVAI